MRAGHPRVLNLESTAHGPHTIAWIDRTRLRSMDQTRDGRPSYDSGAAPAAVSRDLALTRWHFRELVDLDIT
jgi:hypothetical protein